MSMADVDVVNYMEQWFRQNLFYALAPLAVLYILTIGYISLVDQLTIWSAITPLIYMFLTAPVDELRGVTIPPHQLAPVTTARSTVVWQTKSSIDILKRHSRWIGRKVQLT